MLKMVLQRDAMVLNCTPGSLYVNGEFFCYTLEPRSDIKSCPCIPLGRYKVKMYKSPRFGMKVPLLLDVPGRQMIEIHPGNTEHDTRGCILVGHEPFKVGLYYNVYNSREAFSRLVALCSKEKDIELKITDLPF